MLVVLSDTHSRAGHELAGRTAEAVERADAVVHAGDFTSEAALDAFHDAADRLHAVHGNADDRDVQERLPPQRTVEYEGVRILVTHKPEGGETGLAMRGRERGADLVVFGHTHRPTFTDTGDVGLLNPGSHADPRGGPATYAELRVEKGEGNGGMRGELRRRNGSVLREFALAAPTEQRG